MIEFTPPLDIVDLAKYLVESFYPQRGYDEDKLISVAQWVMGKVLEPEEIELFLWTLFDEISITQHPTKMIPIKPE